MLLFISNNVGIANYKSVCELSQSCAVIKETGLSTAFTVAHEIGHRLVLQY